MKPFLESRHLNPQGNGTTLELSGPPRLPRPANHCFVVGEAKRADVIWSEGDFLALCEHMLNQNRPNHFLTAWIDRETGQARFTKASIRIGVPIADGTCEIFPNERAELQPTGKGIRAPGTWNPKSNIFSLIEAETVTPLLETLPRT